jgi:hypothetical protein
MRVSGWGLLSPMLVILGFPAAGLAVKQLHRGPLKLLLFTLLVLAVAAANQWLALRLNSEQTPQGRGWHQWHTAMGLAMQTWTAIAVLLLVIADAFIVGSWTSPLVGWLALPALIVLTMAGIARYGRVLRPWWHHQGGQGHHRGHLRGMRRVG